MRVKLNHGSSKKIQQHFFLYGKDYGSYLKYCSDFFTGQKLSLKPGLTLICFSTAIDSTNAYYKDI